MNIIVYWSYYYYYYFLIFPVSWSSWWRVRMWCGLFRLFWHGSRHTYLSECTEYVHTEYGVYLELLHTPYSGTRPRHVHAMLCVDYLGMLSSSSGAVGSMYSVLCREPGSALYLLLTRKEGTVFLPPPWRAFHLCTIRLGISWRFCWGMDWSDIAGRYGSVLLCSVLYCIVHTALYYTSRGIHTIPYCGIHTYW